MGDFSARLFLLLLPVVLLLFASLRLKRRAVFPHAFFPAARPRPQDLLFRNLRLRYDVILDALAAVVVALALSGIPSPTAGETTVVLDGSRSMLRGSPGDRGLDRAVNLLYRRTDLDGARVLLLDYDANRGSYRLRDFTADRQGEDAPAFSARLARESEPLGADWGLLADLRKRGGGSILVFTDQFPYEAEGFEVVETGFAGLPYAYPASAGYEEATGSWALRLAVEGDPAGLILHRWDEVNAGFSRLAPGEVDLGEGPYGWTVRFPRPGLLLVGVGEDAFPVVLPPRPARPSGSGDFSRPMARVFSFLPERPGEGLLFSDDTGEDAGKAASDDRVTRLSSEDSPLLEDPAEVYGALLPLAVPKGRETALGDAGLDSPDLPLLYWRMLQRTVPPPWLTRPRDAGPGYKPLGTGFYRMTRDGAAALIPPIEEYAPPIRSGPLRLPPPTFPRWPYAAVLAVLYALKLALRRRFSAPGQSPGR